LQINFTLFRLQLTIVVSLYGNNTMKQFTTRLTYLRSCTESTPT